MIAASGGVEYDSELRYVAPHLPQPLHGEFSVKFSGSGCVVKNMYVLRAREGREGENLEEEEENAIQELSSRTWRA